MTSYAAADTCGYHNFAAQAPSHALAQYAATGVAPGSTAAGERVVFNLQDNYIMLQNCATKGARLSRQLAQAAQATEKHAIGCSAEDGE